LGQDLPQLSAFKNKKYMGTAQEAKMVFFYIKSQAVILKSNVTLTDAVFSTIQPV
jgi:hypothetical protein